MADVYLPVSWPKSVDPPGTEHFESTAVTWLLDLVPDLRGNSVARRHPVILATIAWHSALGALDGAREGYRTVRTELGEVIPPHAVDAALVAYRDEGNRLKDSAHGAELILRALLGEPLRGTWRLGPDA